jgi:hypothetical protein
MVKNGKFVSKIGSCPLKENLFDEHKQFKGKYLF